MVIISPSELRGNLKKYLDLAEKERVIIQRGKSEMFELTKKDRISEDDYFDNPENLKIIEEGITDIKKGNFQTLDPKKSLWENIL
ncbi:MAG: type II toxin-antitoxin system Phd/YefM family antitoxin [Bacteroidetes bacterium]|nr:type II toxin-antitoxin system Phd/YefM family antitoxin [Bacteroidota bacterium]MBU1486173.1 type II toxin-antitoxin system Phd/YefM family antitoxin [Bacteroidota bacterium]MBU2046108.1 type II toxin-antitoxin system Phd/YefM family antitoxin [Bacteroidota bacterium]MBU2267051.1 type II toxin-antitoxin system Phd/YefM family antitoxin [Bacteroidota bacterium]MBU2376568.1 type II toxin-antitoxin system Phd/YefM family antitoxin [Bacteroidota bacterium]